MQGPSHRAVRSVVVLLTAALSFSSADTSGHEGLERFIRHDIAVHFQEKYIDLEIELRFNAHNAERERRRMDSDSDGLIAPSELRAFVKRRASGFDGDVFVKVDLTTATLTSLFDPEIDLMGSNKTGPFPFTLRLFYFAPVHKLVHAQSVLTVEDGLWRNTLSIGLLRLGGAVFPPLRHPKAHLDVERGAPLVFRVRCGQAPVPFLKLAPNPQGGGP